jgi:hypothetical protein
VLCGKTWSGGRYLAGFFWASPQWPAKYTHLRDGACSWKLTSAQLVTVRLPDEQLSSALLLLAAIKHREVGNIVLETTSMS